MAPFGSDQLSKFHQSMENHVTNPSTFVMNGGYQYDEEIERNFLAPRLTVKSDKRRPFIIVHLWPSPRTVHYCQRRRLNGRGTKVLHFSKLWSGLPGAYCHLSYHELESPFVLWSLFRERNKRERGVMEGREEGWLLEAHWLEVCLELQWCGGGDSGRERREEEDEEEGDLGTTCTMPIRSFFAFYFFLLKWYFPIFTPHFSRENSLFALRKYQFLLSLYKNLNLTKKGRT